MSKDFPIQCSFDNTGFKTVEDWQCVRNENALTVFEELPDEGGFIWRNYEGTLIVLTGDNPITGKSRCAALNHPGNIQRGYAGKIGISGQDATEVLRFIGSVFMHCQYTKDFDPATRGYI